MLLKVQFLFLYFMDNKYALIQASKGSEFELL